MATKRMLIDATHPEETRVVVVDGSKVEDYDVEVASRRQLKGNIYLAKVTRVEPSLQAAFVDYGGNRHGFLAFNEIHPDYYQIPVADRERLLAEQAVVDMADRDDDGENGAADDEEELQRRRARLSRFYKIQEVIKRRQILLIQVAKEERGNKGAALTTYLSLAGRYCVLMPNTARGGGISRKIVSAIDRKRLKKILSELEVPEGMAVIVRTAGAGRSKVEIKRDYEYLVRLWSNIRETTLVSTAPTLVHEEASLVKRSIRDLYGRDIEEIIVQGEPEYRIAKEFMKLFISSHAKRVKLFEDNDKPLFQAFGVEDLLDVMHQPTVQLKSGGYIVINPTEALVAIDVNSGRSTRERNIEETALRTNLEAADEIARQLRLRELAGLIVVDFIDMENPRNQGMVERRLKEAMKNDRARVQLGRISPFGLLELSRQRLRPSLMETSFEICSTCAGMGLRRTTESTALALLRKLEEEGLKRRSSEVVVSIAPAVAMYLLNQKRRSLKEIEDRYGMAVAIGADASLIPPDFRMERVRGIEGRADEEVVSEVEEEIEAEEAPEAVAGEREEAVRRGRRRRSRRKRRDEDRLTTQDSGEVSDAEPGEVVEAATIEAAESEEEPAAEPGYDEGQEVPARKRRRRGKRGGRRRGRIGAAAPEAGAENLAEGDAADVATSAAADGQDDDDLGSFEEADEEDGEFAESDRAFEVLEEVGGVVVAMPDGEGDEQAEAVASESDEVFAGETAAGDFVPFGEGFDAEQTADGAEARDAPDAEQPSPSPRRRTTRRRRKSAASAAAPAEPGAELAQAGGVEFDADHGQPAATPVLVAAASAPAPDEEDEGISASRTWALDQAAFPEPNQALSYNIEEPSTAEDRPASTFARNDGRSITPAEGAYDSYLEKGDEPAAPPLAAEDSSTVTGDEQGGARVGDDTQESLSLFSPIGTLVDAGGEQSVIQPLTQQSDPGGRDEGENQRHPVDVSQEEVLAEVTPLRESAPSGSDSGSERDPEVVRVGSSSERGGGEEAPRRGWWQRLVT